MSSPPTSTDLCPTCGRSPNFTVGDEHVCGDGHRWPATVPTPRERQLTRYLQGEQEADVMAVRRKRDEAKCALVGHVMERISNWQGDEWQECMRCGAREED